MRSPLPPRWKTLVAFAIIYLVWGSTFYAIRVGVHEVPPLLLAAVRFTVAGALLFTWALARRERLPAPREWAATAAVAVLIFVLDYGILFWAEQRVASGTAAVILATIPAFMALAEIIFLRTQRLTLRLGTALLIGLAGVVVLVDPGLGVAGEPVYSLGAAGLIVSAVSWSAASVLSKRLPLPSSKVMSAAAQMLVGGLMLCVVAAAAGEERGFAVGSVSAAAWIALAYLIVAGSIVGFTAYTWLLHHESPTKVGTYAYVNPVVRTLPRRRGVGAAHGAGRGARSFQRDRHHDTARTQRRRGLDGDCAVRRFHPQTTWKLTWPGLRPDGNKAH